MKNLRKISILSILLIISISGIFFTSQVSACNSTDSVLKKRIPKDNTGMSRSRIIAEWRTSNGQEYLYIEAPNHLVLGLIEGHFLQDKITYMKNVLIQQALALNMTYDDFINLALQYETSIPFKYKIEMRTMAFAIKDISYQDILVQNTMWDGFYGIITPLLSGFQQPPLIEGGCSVIAYKNQSVVRISQNIDLSQMLTPACAWVYHKVGSSPAVFSFRIGSQLSFGGINSNHITTGINLVETLILAEPSLPIPVKYRLALESSNLEEVYETIIDNGFGCGWQFILTSNNEMYSIELIPNTYVSKTIESGYIFDANIYENPLFQAFMIPPNENELFRNQKIPELCENFLVTDGDLTLIELMEIISHEGIARTPQSSNPMEAETSGFYSFDHNLNKGYFGLGNARDSSWGRIPL